MIGSNRVDQSFGHTLPQRFHVLTRAERRRAFRGRAESFKILLVEDQVMRASLRCHVAAFTFGLCDRADTVSDGDMHDVQVATRDLGPVTSALNGLEFRFGRARLSPAGSIGAACITQLLTK